VAPLALCEIFRSAAPDPPAASAELEAALVRLVARAHTAWPELGLPTEGLLGWIAARAEPDEPALAALFVEDLYLAYACAQQHRVALQKFDSEFLSSIDGEVQAIFGSVELLGEVKQQLRERLLTGAAARIQQYRGNGPLKGWVRAAAIRLALNLRHRSDIEANAKRVLGEQMLPTADPELDILKRSYGDAVEGALERALATLDAKQRHLLRLHYIDGVALEKIGVMHRASKTTVWRWLDQSRHQLLAETKRLLHDSLGVSAETLESLLDLVLSSLDISLIRLLGR
jgi:RNA polymerase sigma-70 factor (ECF subfamily)